MFGATAASADSPTPSTGTKSAAHGHGIWIDGLGLNVAGAASAYSEFPDNAGPNTDALNLELLGLLNVDAGTTQLPLLDDGANGGLLGLGDLGAMSSYASSPSDTAEIASSGIITADGALDLGPIENPGSFQSAQLDASGLLRQVISDEVANALLDDATLSVGALASRVAVDGAVESGAPQSEYSLSGMKLDLSSPAVGNLVDGVDTLAGSLIDPIEALLADGGGVETAVGNLVSGIDALPLVDAQLNSLSLDTSSLTTQLRQQLLQTPLENSEGSVSVDLSSGVIHVDLDELVVDSSGASTLSTLAPNTPVLDDVTVNAILDGVTDAIIGDGPNSLITKAVTLITEGIYGVGVNIDLQVGLSVNYLLGTLDVADGPITIKGTLGGVLGQPGFAPLTPDVSGVTLLPGLPIPVNVGLLLQPVVNLITPAIAMIGSALTPVINDVIAGIQPALLEFLQPIVTELLDDAVEPVLNGVLDITINEQPTLVGGSSDFGDAGFTVRALSVTLLPLLGANAVNLELGSSTVLVPAVEATLSASPNPVVQGGTVTLTGAGFTEGEDVDIALPGGGTTTEVAGTGGSVTATWAVPGDFAPGTATFTATGATSALTATATTEVVAASDATLSATPNPVAQGGTVTLTGGGFDDGEDITVTLPDTTTVTATANGSGEFTSTWDVPADYPVGTATFSATGVTSGLTATADTEVEAAAVATLTALPNPVDQGGTVTLAGDGFADSEDVTVTLPDGSTVVEAADADGSFTSTWDVPADYPVGTAEFSATGETSGLTATAETEVQAAAVATLEAAPNPVSQGGVVTLTGDGFGSGEDVIVTLPDGEATVSADIDGSFETTWDVPDDFPVGTAEFSATGVVSGLTATAETTVEADAGADVNANASASASASAQAAADNDASASAQAAAQAAANADNSSDASASADVTADAAASAAATADASTEASAETNAAASASATASADSTADSASNADASASASSLADADASSAADAASEAASEATSSADASASASANVSADADADVNANASASASASADAAADNEASASAQAAAQAAANADNSSDASAAADVTADAAASVAATADASTEASAETNAAASAAATASADSTADSASNADASTSASAVANADASAASDAASEAASEATSSADASAAASANATADADADVDAAATATADATAATNANASASASASAEAAADNDASASAQAAAQAAANADNSSDASASADVTADAAAAVAATADASTEASAETNAAASAAATATADSTADSASNANASASASTAADANASAASNAASEAASDATSSADASSAASANATASANADADADGEQLAVSDPADVTVVEGQPAKFSVKVLSGAPTSVEWQQFVPSDDGAEPAADDWAPAQGVTSDDGLQLTVAAPTLENSGMLYRAVATDGETDVVTDPATLTVEPAGGSANTGGSASSGASASASGSGNASGGGQLTNTGGESQLAFGGVGLLLLLLGAGVAMASHRRNRVQRH